MTDYLQIAKNVVAKAAEQGVEADAFIMDQMETQIQIGVQDVEKLSQSGSTGIGVRVLKDGKVGYAYTADFSPESLDRTLQMALELAEVASEDTYRNLPDPQPIPEEDLGIYDPDLQNVPTEAKIELAKQVQQSARDYDERIKMVPMCMYQDAIMHVYLANTKGFAGSYDKSFAFCFTMAMAGDENDVSEAFGLGASTTFRDLDAREIGQEAAQRALSMLGGSAVPTQKCSVVFDPFVFAELLAYISSAMTGDAMQKGRSFLLDKLGQEIASDKVVLLDNGRMKGGLATAPFDGEGIPTSATRLVDEGIFQNVIYDSYTARKAGKQSTGNAQRDSHRTLPALGMSNFYMMPGDKTPQEIIAGVENGMYVTRIMQTGGIDPISGDCSMGAYGIWIENGKLTQPVAGVTIATTLHELLYNISEVGSDLRMVPFAGAISAPTVRVDDVMVGGIQQ